ncbi:MAG: hypothetical protein ACR2M7_06020 [Bdellovibrionales bacterium]
MRNLILVLTLGLTIASCTKPTGDDDGLICFKSKEIRVEDRAINEYPDIKLPVVVQEFDNGLVIVLGLAGEEYNAFKNTCELNG